MFDVVHTNNFLSSMKFLVVEKESGVQTFEEYRFIVKTQILKQFSIVSALYNIRFEGEILTNAKVSLIIEHLICQSLNLWLLLTVVIEKYMQCERNARFVESLYTVENIYCSPIGWRKWLVETNNMHNLLSYYSHFSNNSLASIFLSHLNHVNARCHFLSIRVATVPRKAAPS